MMQSARAMKYMKLIRTCALNVSVILRLRNASRCAPVDCIPLDPNHVENKEELMEKYKILTGEK